MDNPKVIETVLRKGQTFLNQNKIQGENYNTAYWPMIGGNGNGNRASGSSLPADGRRKTIHPAPFEFSPKEV